jgi:fatty acid desaturase
MNPQPVSYYAHELRADLPPEVFTLQPRRVGWLALHVAIAAGGIAAIAAGVAWPIAIVLTFVIAHSYAGMAFVAHETLHGSTVRNMRLRKLVGGLGFFPMGISPTLWIAWHNRVHHGNAGKLGVDPDVCMTLEAYENRPFLRYLNHLLPGHRHLLGGLTLFYGLTGQAMTVLFSMGSFLGLSPKQRRQVILETALAAVFWGALAVAIGPFAAIFGVILPFFFGNAILTAYVLTNHALSPLTDVNDPLLNSLSVTSPRIVEILHLNFGYHVEHHIFPSVSPLHGPRIRDAIRTRWPGRYQSLSHVEALTRVFGTSRVYKDATTLIDPPSGREFSVLLPRT